MSAFRVPLLLLGSALTGWGCLRLDGAAARADRVRQGWNDAAWGRRSAPPQVTEGYEQGYRGGTAYREAVSSTVGWG